MNDSTKTRTASKTPREDNDIYKTCILLFLVGNESGEKATWGIEMSDLISMMTRDINGAAFPADDELSFIVDPFSIDQCGGNYSRIISIQWRS